MGRRARYRCGVARRVLFDDADFAMMRGILTSLTFISTVLFPWPLTVLLALAISLFEPLVPLAAGLFADTLYHAPQSGHCRSSLSTGRWRLQSPSSCGVG